MKMSEIIIDAWQLGRISEGKAARLLGVDRLTLRTMRDELFKKEENMLCDVCQQPIWYSDDGHERCGCEEDCPCGCAGNHALCVYAPSNNACSGLATTSAPVCTCNMEDGIHDWKCPARPANR